MTTITIKNGEKLSKTDFNDPKDLFEFLREQFAPIQLVAIDEASLSKASLNKIITSKNNPDKELTDFQG